MAVSTHKELTINIFVFHPTPHESAADHCDKHTNKMILEYTQMLSDTVRHYRGTPQQVGKRTVNLLPDDVLSEDGKSYTRGSIYKSTHHNHPCTQWVRQSRANFIWLYALTHALNKRYRKHSGRDHASMAVARRCMWLMADYAPFPSQGLTPFAQAMPDECKQACPVKAYRDYFRSHKRHLAQWRDGTPAWYS